MNSSSEINKTFKEFTVSIMPDVFIDRFLKVESLEKFTSEIYEKSKVGGGSIRGYRQRDIIGGNAINFAKTIFKLGGNVNLFVIGNEFIKRELESLFRSEKSNINIIEGRPGYTIALEIQNENNKANIMFSDVGDLRKFNGDELDNEELENIAESNASVIVNWSSINEGNKLIKKIFSNSKNANSVNFLDLADPKSVTSRIPELITIIKKQKIVDILSINENELRILSEHVGISNFPIDYKLSDIECNTLELSKELGIQIESHTPIGASTASENEVYCCKAFEVNPNSLTGAGDVWNAANLLSMLAKFSRKDRMYFANACSALYISNIDSEIPSIGKILEYIESKKTI